MSKEYRCDICLRVIAASDQDGKIESDKPLFSLGLGRADLFTASVLDVCEDCAETIMDKIRGMNANG